MKAAVRKAATPRRRAASRGNERRLVTQHHPRRRILRLAAGAAVLPALPRISWAQAFPTRPITWIVPLAAGSSMDVGSRILAQRMGTALRQQIIVENVTGADGNIAMGRIARVRPDGYTIGLGSSSTNVLNGAFYSLSYDLFGDLAPISPVGAIPYVLYGKTALPANDLKELIIWLRANPNKASAGVITAGYRTVMALFQRETGTRFALVPYRGFPPELQDLIAGQIDFFFDSPVQLPFVREGKIKAIAVTSDARLPQAPDIPTAGEMGLPALTYSAWWALFAPKNIPNEIISSLNRAAVEALADPTVRSRLAVLGLNVYPRERQTPGALDAIRKADAEKWWPIIKELGIKAE
jgi:tripartite-type tricarboxylate transporter receptor subunit TctC